MTSTTTAEFDSKTGRPEDVLPQWNFDNFYPAYSSPEFNDDFTKLEKMVGAFAKKYKGKIDSLTGDQLANALKADKAIEDLLGKMATYISLKTVQDFEKHGAENAGFEERYSPLLTKLVFFSHEINNLSEEQLNEKLAASKQLEKWKPALDNVRRSIPHMMEQNVTEYAGEIAAGKGMVKLYDDLMASLKFPLDGEELRQEQILTIIADSPNKEERAKAQQSFQEVITAHGLIFSSVHNESMRLNMVNSRWKNFENPWDSRHFSNNIAPEVVDALENAVKGAYPRIAHRFYALKAKLMGQEKLNIYDRNVNVLEAEDAQKISWSEAKAIVLDAFSQFSPRVADIAEEFFDKGWIDAVSGGNKASGAFSHPGAAQLENPMVMVNYLGTSGDVSTLAHELGHGVHQVLASHKGAKTPQGDGLVRTPLTLAETASVFGEMVTFKSLLATAKNDDERRKMLFDKVNDMLNTVVRQISFYDFEKRIHTQFQESAQPLKQEDFAKHWLDVSRESLGPAVEIKDDYGPVYGYVPHLIHSPFYVYAYAFGDALVNALYQVYEEGNIPDFEEKYIKILEGGGTIKPKDLKEMFGLDISDPTFWDKGLNVIESFLDELEELCEPLLEIKAEASNDHN